MIVFDFYSRVKHDNECEEEMFEKDVILWPTVNLFLP